jgi:hypothetical protein
MDKPKNNEGFLYLRGLSPHLKSQFKAHAARRGKSMTEMITEFMLNCVRSDVPPQEAKKLKKEVMSPP